MAKRKILSLLGTLSIIGLLSACNITSGNTNNTNSTNTPDVNTSESKGNTTVDETAEETEEVTQPVVTVNTLTITVNQASELGIGNYTTEGNKYIITAAGEYDIVGDLSDGEIIINASEDDEVLINLNGVNITSTTSSPINVISASKVEISTKKETKNYITDARTSESDDSDAAIYSDADLKIKGKGELYVYGNYNNGIHSKDDLDIKNLTLYVSALNNAIKGNDSVTIDTANLTVISTGGDGIKSTNSDISSKGNQRGTITITGSSDISIYACCDGIDAAYNIDILADSEGNEPTLNIYTSAYSSYSDDSPTTVSSSNSLYVQITSSYYSSSYDYYLYCYDTLDTSINAWSKLSVYTQTQAQGFGGRSQATYYYLKGSVDTSKYSGVQLYMFKAGETPSTTSYYAASTGQAINQTKDMLTVKSITSSTKKIGVDWSNYSSQSSTQMGPGGMGGMNQGNTDKTSYSTKGLKAQNDITISAGNINIKAYDDGIHTESNVTLENGYTSVGLITISGGNITILSKDDGIHSDSTLNITGGYVTISSAYEGIEANVINISGGSHYVYATDDGLNGSGNGAKINISGGTLEVLVASGDTDAIDSNGTYTQTGGVVVSMNLSQQGTATVLDCDGTATISGGTFIGFGNLESSPRVSNLKSKTVSANISAGTYTIKYNDTLIITITLKTNYSRYTLIGSAGAYLIGSSSVTLS